MIHPCLATMLVVITTDYPLDTGEPIAFLRPAVDRSFNRISVDGDCSTNDAVVLIANGASGAPPRRRRVRGGAPDRVRRPRAPDRRRRRGRDRRARDHRHRGAHHDAEAEAVARRIATSPLVKTAAFGRDPNWGRVLAAAGSAPFNGGFAHLDPREACGGLRRHPGRSRTAPRQVSRRRSRAPPAGSRSTSGSATGPRPTSRRISRTTT